MQSSTANNNENLVSNKLKVVIEKLSSVLYNLVVSNQQDINNSTNNYNNNNSSISSFDLKSTPNISLENYILRITIYSKISESTLICALVLLDKFISNTKIELSFNNIYLLILSSIQAAMKVNEDIILNDFNYAFLGMINIKTLIKVI